MNKAILAYAVEDTKIAESIISEKESKEIKFNIECYPVLNNNFWDDLSNEKIDTKNILIICSQSFIQKHKFNLYKYAFRKNNDRYIFSLILIDEETKRDGFISNIPSNVDVFHYYNTSTESSSEIIEFIKALQVIENRDTKYKLKTTTKKALLFKQSSLLLIFSVLFSLLSIVLTIIIYGDSFFYESTLWIIMLITTAGAIALFFSLYDLILRSRRKAEQSEKDEFKKELDNSLSQTVIKKSSEINFNSVKENKENEIDQFIGVDEYQLLGHLKLNWLQMKGYYDISKRQATRSFWCAIVLCFLGFSIIAFAIFSPLIPGFTKENSIIQIIGTIGGAVVEVISGTIFIVYSKSLSQMNLYHKALSNYQQYLNCVNLVSKLSTVEKQDAFYEKIILNEMNKINEFVNDEINNKKT